MEQHALALIEDLTNESARTYLTRVLDHKLGRRKSSPARPKGMEAPEAAGLRDQLELALLLEEPILIEPPPVPAPAPVKDPPARFSVSLMNKAEDCLRSAWLGREFDVSGEPAILGSLVHEVCDVLSLNAYRDGRATYTPQEAIGYAQDALEDPKETTPLAKRAYDAALEMVGRWAARMEFWPDAELFLTEQLVTLEVAGMTFSGRVDVTQVRGERARVDDYKTGFKPPTQEEFRKKLQTPFYAAAQAPLLPFVAVWDVGELWVRWEMPRLFEEIPTEQLSLDRYLTAAGKRLQRAWATGEFPATPGPHCANCPLPERCPYPPALRPDAAIDTDQHARDAIDWLTATDAQLAKVKRQLRGYMARHEQTSLTHHGMEATLTVSTQENLDRSAVRSWVAGHGGDPDAFFTSRPSTRFALRRAGDDDDGGEAIAA